MNSKFDISVILITRGRTDALSRSVSSLYDLAKNPERIQILFGFDKDDDKGLTHWNTTLKPWLDERHIPYTCLKFDPMGYTKLHIYSNKTAKFAQGDWMIIWNDDAIMQTLHWDEEIMKYRDRFRLLAFHTHKEHPYSIFPIIPRKWYDLLGYLSPHPTQDGWLSQQAYMLDILERIPVWVEHDRFDLTGNNQDETYKNRRMLEGNPNDPSDFHNINQTLLRQSDATKIADYLKNELNQDMTFWDNIWLGKQDPWVKLKENDINQQMVQFNNPYKFAEAVKKARQEASPNQNV